MSHVWSVHFFFVFVPRPCACNNQLKVLCWTIDPWACLSPILPLGSNSVRPKNTINGAMVNRWPVVIACAREHFFLVLSMVINDIISCYYFNITILYFSATLYDNFAVAFWLVDTQNMDTKESEWKVLFAFIVGRMNQQDFHNFQEHSTHK